MGAVGRYFSISCVLLFAGCTSINHDVPAPTTLFVRGDGQEHVPAFAAAAPPAGYAEFCEKTPGDCSNSIVRINPVLVGRGRTSLIPASDR